MDEIRKVLVLENRFAVAQVIATAFRANNWEVFFATDAEYAQPVTERAKPDAVVLNSQIIGTGMKALLNIRASAHTANIPVFCIIDADKDDAKAWAEAGAQKCFTSPADPTAILNDFEKLIQPTLLVDKAPQAITGNLERLRALASTGLLDSAADPRFDELTALTAALVDVPTVLLSLVDQDRQFFKSQFGLAEPWSSERETPLTHSFCQWVVSEKKELLVFDAREHPVLSQNLAVRDLGVKAYAGMPLQALPGQTIGSFCAIDSDPHEWTEYEVATIEDMAQIANAFIILLQAEKAKEDSELTILAIKPSLCMEAASNAITGATRILNRGGKRLGAEQRKILKSIIKRKSEDLLRFAEGTDQ